MKKKPKHMTILKKLCSITLACCTSISLVACKEPVDKTQEPIQCYFDFQHPTTGEYLKKEYGIGYEDVYLTYDGTEKTLDYVIRRWDTREIVEMKIIVDITYTYMPENESYEYRHKAMNKQGKWALIVNDYDYNIEKYYIELPASVYVFIQ